MQKKHFYFLGVWKSLKYHIYVAGVSQILYTRVGRFFFKALKIFKNYFVLFEKQDSFLFKQIDEIISCKVNQFFSAVFRRFAIKYIKNLFEFIITWTHHSWRHNFSYSKSSKSHFDRKKFLYWCWSRAVKIPLFGYLFFSPVWLI